MVKIVSSHVFSDLKISEFVDVLVSMVTTEYHIQYIY